jgi:hypothetical protein
MYFVLIIFIWIFLSSETNQLSFHISYGDIRFDMRVLWITSTCPEQIMLANRGTTALLFQFQYIFITIKEVQ